jgi:hypothetical protein
MKTRRSIFGPLLLIAAGAMWLLIQYGSVPSGNLWALTHIWPYLIIAAGVGLILKPYWAFTNIALDVLIVAGAVLAILFAPRLGWDNPAFLAFANHGEVFFGPTERGSGNVITQAREIGAFDSLKVEYPARVLITQGEAVTLEISAEDNLLPGLKTQVNDGTLEIFYRKTGEKNILPTRPVTLNITVTDLNSIDFSSAGELTIDGLTTDRLRVNLSGAGNLELKDIDAKELSVNLSGAGSMTASGTGNNLDVNISGFGDLKAGNLHSHTARVTISGAGSATVWADERLNVNISGAGSVNYHGAASVSKQINGLGGVNHVGDK